MTQSLPTKGQVFTEKELQKIEEFCNEVCLLSFLLSTFQIGCYDGCVSKNVGTNNHHVCWITVFHLRLRKPQTKDGSPPPPRIPVRVTGMSLDISFLVNLVCW